MKYPVAVKVNGRLHRSEVAARTLLVDYLRDGLGLRGTHFACGAASCRACAVLCGGKLIRSCTRLAAQVDGAELTTVEGVAGEPLSRRIVRSFEEQCLGCALCAPAVLLAAHQAAREAPCAAAGFIAVQLAGPVCGCGAAASRLAAAAGACIADESGGPPELLPQGRAAAHGPEELVEDIALADILDVELVRSVHAHARVTSIDASRAIAVPGVVGVFTHADLGTRLALPALAPGEARFAGEAIAAVVAVERDAAADAAAGVDIGYDPLPVKLDAAGGTGEGGAYSSTASWGDPGAVFQAADRVVRLSSTRERALLPRGVPRASLSRWDAAAGELVLWTSTAAPHQVRSQVASALRLPVARVRVVAPAAGGFMSCASAEDLLVCALALELSPRPVRWVERSPECLRAAPQRIGSTCEVEIAAREDGRLLGLRLRRVDDAGAFLLSPPGRGSAARREAVNAYELVAGTVEVTGTLTNKPPGLESLGSALDATVFAVERAVDRVAAELDLDPIELRRSNLLDSAAAESRESPGRTSGRRLAQSALERLVEASRHASLRAERARRRELGELVGIGVAVNAGAPAGPAADALSQAWEAATVRVHADGSAEVAAPAVSSSRWTAAVLAAAAARALGLDASHVHVRRADTGGGPGAGGWSDHSPAMAAAAVHQAAREIERKLRRVAALVLHVGEDYVERRGLDFVAGSRSASFAQVCQAAHAACSGKAVLEAGLEASAVAGASSVEAAVSAHLAVVEVDRDTGVATIERHIAVVEVGRALVPAAAKAAVHRAVAAGIRLALEDALIHDPEGQPILLGGESVYGTMDPAPVELVCLETPSPAHPLGMRSLGDGAIAAAAAATVNAALDALQPLGVRHLDPPLGPERIWEAMSAALVGSVA